MSDWGESEAPPPDDPSWFNQTDEDDLSIFSLIQTVSPGGINSSQMNPPASISVIEMVHPDEISLMEMVLPHRISLMEMFLQETLKVQ